MYVIKKERILNKAVGNYTEKRKDVENLMNILNWKEIDFSLIKLLVNNNVNHISWRYQLVKSRYKKNSYVRCKILGIKPNKETWLRSPNEKLDISYWMAQGYTEECAIEKRNEYTQRYRAPYTKERGEKLSKSIRESVKHQEAMRRLWSDQDFRENIFSLAKKARDEMPPVSIDPKRNHFNIAYWIEKGYTEEESANILSNQSSRTRESFIEKYGEIEGNVRFEKMKERRLRSWNDKTKDEKAEINDKRRKNAHVGIYNNDTIVEIEFLNFYAFRNGDGIKFGLTKHDSLFKRWSRNLVEEILFFINLPSQEALSIEMKIKNEFNCVKNHLLNTTEFIHCDNGVFQQFIGDLLNDKT